MLSYPFYYFFDRISVFLIVIFGFWLAFWVYFANRKAKVNKTFFIFTILLVLWTSFPPLFNSPNISHNSALLLIRLAYGTAAIFLIIFYFFAVYFPREGKRSPILDKIVFLIGISLFFISTFTDLHVKNIEVREWGNGPIFGPSKIFYFGSVIFIAALFIRILSSKYSKFSREEKTKIQYVLVGLFIFILFNIIFNVLFPLGFGELRYYPLGNYSTIFLLGFTAYAIVKRELFGIRVVLTQILVGVIAIVLLVQALGSATIFEYIWKGAVFLIFLFFGFLLIRSVMREIKLREALQQAYAKLQVLDKAKSEFISIASHQLRTPLTAIKGYISMILEGSYGEMPEKAQRPVENVYKSAERLINLVNDLLSVSRLEAGKIKVEPKKVSIEELILGIIEELKIKADEKKIYLKFQQPLNPLPKVIIDPDKIRQVILNIIDNAIRYTITGGITVEAEVEAGKLRVIIADTGEGMTREERSHLFESFSRGAAGGRLWTEGSGLGLYVARRFVEMHQGKVWVESEGKGKGSTFFIELPRKPENQKFNEFMRTV